MYVALVPPCCYLGPPLPTTVHRTGLCQKLMKHGLAAFILLCKISATKLYKSNFSPMVKCLYPLLEVRGSDLSSHIIIFLACSLTKTRTGSDCLWAWGLFKVPQIGLRCSSFYEDQRGRRSDESSEVINVMSLKSCEPLQSRYCLILSKETTISSFFFFVIQVALEIASQKSHT